jgi:hypothetical protein
MTGGYFESDWLQQACLGAVLLLSSGAPSLASEADLPFGDGSQPSDVSPYPAQRWSDEYGWPSGCNGPVYAVALADDGRIYAGGEFQNCSGVHVNSVAVYDPAANSWSALGSGSGRGVNARVEALTLVDGNLYVGGAFTRANGTEIVANGVARWDGESWSALATSTGNGVSGSIHALTIHDGSLYVGGAFSAANHGSSPVPSRGIARWDGSQWLGVGTEPGSGTNGSVYALTSTPGRLLVGGNFTLVNAGMPVAAANVAAWDGLAWSALEGAGGNGVDGSVRAIVADGDDVIVGGTFQNANAGAPIAASYIARWRSGQWQPLGSGSGQGTGNYVYALAIDGSDVLAGGAFSTVNIGQPVPAERLARWRNDAWEAITPNPGAGANGTVLALAVSDGTVVAGGSATRFTDGGPVAAHSISTLTESGWQPMGSGPGLGLNGVITAMVDFAGDTYIAGEFTTAGDQVANYIARRTTTGWAPVGSAGGNGLSGPVWDLKVFNGELYVAGTFDQANVGAAVQARNIARWDGSQWRPLGGPGSFQNGVNGTVLEMETYQGELYVGGGFTTTYSPSGFLTVNRLARWNGSRWAAVGTGSGRGVNGGVNSFAQLHGELYIGGDFTEVNVGAPLPANRVVRWDGVQWLPIGSGAGNGVSASVSRLTATADRLYVGGAFSTVNVGEPVAANRIASWDGVAWSALGSGAGNGVSSVVNGLAFDGTNLYVGGSFTQANVGASVLAPYIARWDGNRWQALRSTPSSSVSGQVQKLFWSEGQLTVSGNFSYAGGLPSMRLGRYRTHGQLTVTSSGAGSGWVRSQPAGIQCPPECDAAFAWDQPIQLTATTWPGSTFGGWSASSCAGANPCVLELARDSSLVAVFDRTTYTIGGQISGLQGTGLMVRLNGGTVMGVAGNGSFVFPTELPVGDGYQVTVAAHPTGPNQTCAVANGVGVVTTAHVTSVAITCTTEAYSLGGNVVGLAGSGLRLRNNGSDYLDIFGNGAFTFELPVPDGTGYLVAVENPPASPNQVCHVANGSGTVAGAAVTNLLVTCTTTSYTIGGSVVGLAGTGLLLSNNGGEPLSVDTNGPFVFPASVADGGAFNVTVQTNPIAPGQSCTVQNGMGIVAGGNVSNIAVSCVDDPVVSVVLVGAGSGSITSVPAGINCPGTCSASFPRTAAVSLFSVAAPEARSLGWHGVACPDDSACSLMVTQSKTIAGGFGVDAGRSLRFFASGVNAPTLDRVAIAMEPAGRPVNVGAGDFTLELWLRTGAPVIGTVPCTEAADAWIEGDIVVDRDVYGAGDRGDFGLSIMSGRLAFGLGQGDQGTTVCTARPIQDGTWHHIAVTRSVTSGWIDVWVDGELDGSGQGPPGDVSYRVGRPTPWFWDPYLVLGAEKHDAGAQFPSFAGWLDEIRLSTGRRYIEAFVPETRLTRDAATVSLYRFDEGDGSIIFDEAGAGTGPSHGERRPGGAFGGPCWDDDTPSLGRVFAGRFDPDGCL